MREHAVNMNQVSIGTGYNPANRHNDIAILRLVNPIIPTADVHPIQLPPINVQNLILPLENEEGQVAGFGFQTLGGTGPNNFLYRGYQRTTTAARCLSWYLWSNDFGFCAEDDVEGSNGCQGDIGNPFVISYRRQDMLVGLLSIHPSCGSRSPAAYTRITHFRAWIEAELAI